MDKLGRQYRFGPFWFDQARRDLRRDGAPLRARTQALDLLTALLENPGALISKSALMKAAWPGLHVDEGNISVQVHYLRRLLQDGKKPYRWIATEPGRGYRFIGALETEPSLSHNGAAPCATSVGAALPDASGPLIGRERELATLQAQMPRHRLITVTGFGGMGKTRLAIEFAREHALDPLNKTLFLGLEGMRQKDQIGFRLAGRLGVQPVEGPQMATILADALQKQGYLIIFDNCEHVLHEVATLVEAILKHAPGVKILATSREPLQIADECVFPLGPLQYPTAMAALSAVEIKAFTAVRLFADKAQTSNPAFTLSEAALPDVVALCRKLEGIPLALQLAAASLHAVSISQFLNDISTPSRLAPIMSPGIPARHRTVEATIAWSVALLSEQERAALRRLSVFPRSFTMAAAQAVIAGELITAGDTGGLLFSLCDKSLLIMSPAYQSQMRFRLLESTRDYGYDMLAQAGETKLLSQRLAAFVVTEFGNARDAWPHARADDWSATYERDIETLRATIDWAFGPDGDRTIAASLAARLRAPYSDRLITQREFLSAIGRALMSLDAVIPAQDQGWIFLSASYDLSLGLDQCARHAAAALEHFRKLGDPALIGVAAARASVLLAINADAALPNLYLDEALAVLALVPANRYQSAILLNVATSFAVGNGDENLKLAHLHFERALPIANAFNDHAQIALIGANLAELEAKIGNYDAAISRATVLAQTSRSRRDLQRLSHDLLNLMQYNLMANQVSSAQGAAVEAIQLLIDFEDEHWGADYGGRFAMLAVLSENWYDAAQLAGFSDHYYVSQKKVRQVVDQRVWDRLERIFIDAVARGILRNDERLKLFRQGAKMSLRDALLISQSMVQRRQGVLAN